MVSVPPVEPVQPVVPETSGKLTWTPDWGSLAVAFRVKEPVPVGRNQSVFEPDS